MKAISYYFLRGETTVRNIVETTSESLWSVLQPLYMPVPTKESWTNVAERYQELWNLPNCVGSIDGKHIRIKAPANSGSAFYNYKGFFSIVLMATADADGKFITIDVGEYGRNSDGRVLKECAFGQQLLKNKLDLPEPSTLPGEENEPPYAYYFVGDEAFPLMNNLLRPYPRRQLTNAKRIFNYR
ncbi:protein ANTAGONIST OF LIKE HETEROCHROMATIN PROTEIN 1-like [Acyrthosiphon pisum]|nr:protein ANTAGONIST OF LIKE HETEROCHROMATIN PROTEIN 1-like [Acyrthosiphon pisum]